MPLYPAYSPVMLSATIQLPVELTKKRKYRFGGGCGDVRLATAEYPHQEVCVCVRF